MKKVKILDVQFDVCTHKEALQRCIGILTSQHDETAKQIVTPNPEMLLLAQKNRAFKDVLNKAWLSVADGSGILWASAFQEISKKNSSALRPIKWLLSLASIALYPKFCRRVFIERISGVDLMQSLCRIAADRGLSVFLLGAGEGIANKAAENIKRKNPRLKIAGAFGATPSEDDFTLIHALIAESRPALLFVAYGAPSQELWIKKHSHKFPSVKIAMGVGGAFDFLAGVKPRAPRLMRSLGLEWLYRLNKEPSRIKRIYNAVIAFPLKILRRH